MTKPVTFSYTMLINGGRRCIHIIYLSKNPPWKNLLEKKYIKIALKCSKKFSATSLDWLEANDFIFNDVFRACKILKLTRYCDINVDIPFSISCEISSTKWKYSSRENFCSSTILE